LPEEVSKSLTMLYWNVYIGAPRRVLRVRMTDRVFYLAVTLLVLALAAGEIAYGMFGPFSARQHQIDEFSSSNRAPPSQAARQ
jgi:hypothetical protein